MSTLAKVVQFWEGRPALGNMVKPHLWFPISGAAIERSFSLAGAHTSNHVKEVTNLPSIGLVDTKNRNAGSEELKEAAVVMFCNGELNSGSTKV